MSSNLTPIIAAMSDPFFELDTGEAAAVLSAFDTARAAGHPFDPFTVALVNVLRRQLVTTDANSDDDTGVDDGWEEDDAEQSLILERGRKAVA